MREIKSGINVHGNRSSGFHIIFFSLFYSSPVRLSAAAAARPPPPLGYRPTQIQRRRRGQGELSHLAVEFYRFPSVLWPDSATSTKDY